MKFVKLLRKPLLIGTVMTTKTTFYSTPRLALSLSALCVAGACAPVEEGEAQEFASSENSITIDTSATFTLVGVQSNKCVEVKDGSTSAGAVLQIADCNGSKRQQFKAESMGSGYYRLRNVNSNMCVDVYGARTSDGAAAVQWDCHSGYNQQWSFTDVSGGSELITARHSGKVLDVAGWGTSNGTLLHQWSKHGGANQQFRLQTGTKTFSQCRFHFGTIDSVAKNAGSSMISQLDYFTPGWMLGSSFDQSYVCEEGNPGGALANQVPVIVAYVAAGIVKRNHNLCDCNVSGCSGGDLCRYGAQYIERDWSTILAAYRSYSAGYASCYGTTRPLIFQMEPDWYQYTYSSQTSPWTAAQAGARMTELVNALKSSLPNARFSLDISPWVTPNNGEDNGRQWYANFDMSLFAFINTSGGGTNANTQQIRPYNNMTWSGLHSVTGKPILADTGYGANGVSAGHDYNWDDVNNLNARIADGVIGISQYNAKWDWGYTISNVRSKLSSPRSCP